MNKIELINLLNGEMVVVKNNWRIIGAVQLDLECDKFLALSYDGKDLQGEDDYFSLNLWDTLEEAIEEIKNS
jgi:hypothetical protein